MSVLPQAGLRGTNSYQIRWTHIAAEHDAHLAACGYEAQAETKPRVRQNKFADKKPSAPNHQPLAFPKEPGKMSDGEWRAMRAQYPVGWSDPLQSTLTGAHAHHQRGPHSSPKGLTDVGPNTEEHFQNTREKVSTKEEVLETDTETQQTQQPAARLVSLHGNEEAAAARERRNAEAAIDRELRRLNESKETEAQYDALLNWIDPSSETYQRAVKIEMRDPDKGRGLAFIRQAYRDASLSDERNRA